MDFLQSCIALLSGLLAGWNLPLQAAETLARYMILGVPVYAVFTVLFFIGRITKAVKRSVSFAERLTETLAAAFLAADVAFIALLIRYWPQAWSFVKASEFWVFKGEWWKDPGNYSNAFLTAFIILAVAAALIGLLITSSKYLVSMVRQEVRDHGVLLGAVLSVYDFFAGPVTLTLCLTAWAFLKQIFS